MNNNDEKYAQFELVKEMTQTGDIIRNFSVENADAAVSAIKSAGKLLLTGEGSSRIFPAKNAICAALAEGTDLQIITEGARQAADYKLDDFAIFAASNSGSTKEAIALLDQLKKDGHNKIFGLTARENTTLSEYAEQTFVLNCGWEQAVAATKSVAEQALVYQEILAQVAGGSIKEQLPALADAVDAALSVEIDAEITNAIANAGTIYFAGKNNGVAEELTLKTNEITRKKSDYLEGTYCVHGIEEVMNFDDVVIVIDPFEDELQKIKETLVDVVGLTVITISTKETIFPSIVVSDQGALQNYVYLAAGWNILIEAGLQLGVNLDKAERARKVGNEFVAAG
ncbi:MAG: SIS domain-containing protein [Planctomycetes bacterium]|nr:SIS domain-containing protein [Planctomycetota bacterium]